jgi:hypothetical protein
MKLTKFLWSIPLLILAFIQPVSATTGMVGSSATAAGPLNLLVSLGIENIPSVSVSYALFIYRFISFGLIMLLAMSADRRTQEIFSILIVALAALFAYFGWWTVLLPNGNINPAGPWSMVIFCAIIAAISYMTSQKQLNFGISGAGDPVVNLFMFFIIFNSCLGMISSTNVFAMVPGVADAPEACTSNNYANCQVNGATALSSIGTPTSSGGFFSNLGDYATMFMSAGVNTIMLVLSIALSLVFVAGTILITYPWIANSPPAMILLGVFQLVIYILYYLMFMRWTAKTMPGEARL